MNGKPLPSDTIKAVDAGLTEALGMHGPWVLATETYNEAGEPQLAVMWDPNSTGWARVGMARALLLDLEEPFTRRGDDD